MCLEPCNKKCFWPTIFLFHFTKIVPCKVFTQVSATNIELQNTQDPDYWARFETIPEVNFHKG